jgi:alkanesulfonate monooxygenase SsuD/methylene tetrahydromethanopterin reductase-like flavin-dependent oxidoreductase (luciferase family)
MANLGLHGTPERREGATTMDHYRELLEQLPPAFSTVWISDHLQFGADPQQEAWTLLTYLAAAFPRFRYGHLVLCQSYRNPALLAKMAATLQELSGGRFILGLGAGWHEEEYRAYDFPYPRPGIRVQQLAEAIEIAKAMWTQSPATFEGEHYRIEGAYCEPRPQVPIPVLVGTNGPRAIAVTARLADTWCWDGPWDVSYRRPHDVLREACEAIGRPFEDIALHAELAVELPDDPSAFVPTYEHSFYPGQVFGIAGPTPADVAREIEALVDHRVSHIAINVDTWSTLRRFIDEVVPVVRLEPLA